MEQTITDAEDPSVQYATFLRDAEPRLRHALCGSFGADLGREATAHAVAVGFERWLSVRAMTNPVGYLFTVGRNYARRDTRARSRTTNLLPDVPTSVEHWVEPGLPKALSNLTERQRTAIVLVHGLGWTYAETAEAMEVSRATVQTQVRRAMRRLRSDLGEPQ